MLVALFIIIFLGGGSVEVFTEEHFEALESVVEEPERVAQASDVMRRMNSRVSGLARERQEHLASLGDIDADVEASLESYNEVFDRLWQVRSHAADGYVRDVFDLREHLTREEWAAIFDPPIPDATE